MANKALTCEIVWEFKLSLRISEIQERAKRATRLHDDFLQSGVPLVNGRKSPSVSHSCSQNLRRQFASHKARWVFHLDDLSVLSLLVIRIDQFDCDWIGVSRKQGETVPTIDETELFIGFIKVNKGWESAFRLNLDRLERIGAFNDDW